MYNDHYGSTIEPENVMVFAGGRCAIFTVLLFLKKNVQVIMLSQFDTGLYLNPYSSLDIH